MSTRSYIGISDDLFNTNAAKCIYCNFDGYLEGVGNTLASFYNNALSVEALISKGSLSSLQDSVEECEFYADDSNIIKSIEVNFIGEQFVSEISKIIDYFYVFDRRKNRWFVVEKTGFDLFPAYIPLRKILKGYDIKPRKKK